MGYMILCLLGGGIPEVLLGCVAVHIQREAPWDGILNEQGRPGGPDGAQL